MKYLILFLLGTGIFLSSQGQNPNSCLPSILKNWLLNLSENTIPYIDDESLFCSQSSNTIKHQTGTASEMEKQIARINSKRDKMEFLLRSHIRRQRILILIFLSSTIFFVCLSIYKHKKDFLFI